MHFWKFIAKKNKMKNARILNGQIYDSYIMSHLLMRYHQTVEMLGSQKYFVWVPVLPIYHIGLDGIFLQYLHSVEFVLEDLQYEDYYQAQYDDQYILKINK